MSTSLKTMLPSLATACNLSPGLTSSILLRPSLVTTVAEAGKQPLC